MPIPWLTARKHEMHCVAWEFVTMQPNSRPKANQNGFAGTHLNGIGGY
jgi:hypothetical protein